MHPVTSLKVVTLIGLLAGGLSLSYADAPVASLNVSSGAVQVQPMVPSNNTPTNSTPSAVQQTPPQPVVNSSAMLATLTPEQRIARLENQVQYLSGYSSQLQSLSSEVEMLRGQIEDLNYQLAQMKKQLNAGNPPATPTPDNTGNAPTGSAAASNSAIVSSTAANTNASNTPAAPTAKEQAAFNQAYNLLLKQQYTQATTGFTSFLTAYPNSTLAPDAHYWLGDLYLAQGQPDNASQQYRAVVNMANADKRPDAMVKLGTILLAYGDNAHAKQLFQQVVQQYPKSPAAQQAQSRLKTMQ